MDDQRLADCFETDRPRLAAVAYRMLGSHTEAHDQGLPGPLISPNPEC